MDAKNDNGPYTARVFRLAAVVVLAGWALAAFADDLARAEQLAWSRRFAESEALYRSILEKEPSSRRAQLGLARVVMWSGRYPEAISRFDVLLRGNAGDTDALEGRATAEYWSGDLRAAARDFRRVLQLDPKRETARVSLSEITATMRPLQRFEIGALRDDQPFDVGRASLAATFFPDPLSRLTATLGATHFDAGQRGTRRAEWGRVDYDTRWRELALGASAGIFDDDFVGGARIGWRRLALSIDRREELSSATAIHQRVFSTTTALRWSHDRKWIGMAEASRRSYSDDNRGWAIVGYAVAPVFKRNAWTVWAGASAAARGTEETRFHPTAVSSVRDATFFHYTYRGEYDPYWTPDDLVEARGVLAIERELPRGKVKLQADAGAARDRGRAFGPDAGSLSLPQPSQIYTFAFDRDYHPYRLGLSAELALTRSFSLEGGVERSVTVDYRATSLHAAVVRRR
jgi:tetratricopeptide (TPR) repeat protein